MSIQLSKQSAFGILVSLFAFLVASAGSQIIGKDICYCAPPKYEFTLDFSLACPPVNIALGDAVAAVSCFVSPFGDPAAVTDLIPVSVQSIEIQELDHTLTPITTHNITGTFGNGDTFSYTSVAASLDETVDPIDIPRAIQLNIIGVNQFEEPIINGYMIRFTNTCGPHHALLDGESAGWTRFVSHHLQTLCVGTSLFVFEY